MSMKVQQDMRTRQGSRSSGIPGESNYGKRNRFDPDSVMYVEPERHSWGWYPVGASQMVRHLVPARPDEHPAERALENSRMIRLYDHRFKTAFIVHPSKATYASAADAGAIILYLPGASCVHSQGTAMLYQLNFFTKKGYPGVAIDHAFHGNGPRDPAFFGLNAYMAWINSIVEYSKRMYADVPIGLFGRSAGANVALEYAYRYPGEAAFVIAMSGYDPAWTPYSLFHIDNMVKAGEFAINQKGLDWINYLDSQWMWNNPRASRRVSQNNVLIMAGDRDDEYPWHEHQIADDHARGYGIPPVGGDPYYIGWWRRYAGRVGAELAVIADGAHNVFDTRNFGVVRAAEEAVLGFLKKTVPVASKDYFIGRPFQFGSLVMTLPADADEIERGIADLEDLVAKNPHNIRGMIHLAIIHQAMAARLADPAAAARETESAERWYGKALPKIKEQAAYLLLGRPVGDPVVQIAVRDALANFSPLAVIPRTPSVGAFVSIIGEVASLTHSPAEDFTVTGTLYDFSNQMLAVEGVLHNGAIKSIALVGGADVLRAARERWARNKRIHRADASPSMLIGIADGLHRRDSVEIETMPLPNGERLLLRPANGHDIPVGKMLVRFLELFFEYWPHPTVRDFISRIDDRATWEGLASQTEGVPQFEFQFGSDGTRVMTASSEETDGTMLTLADLRSQIDQQERNPNGGAFRSRRSTDTWSQGAFSIGEVPVVINMEHGVAGTATMLTMPIAAGKFQSRLFH